MAGLFCKPIDNQCRALSFEHLEDRLLLLLGMGTGLRMRHAAIEQIRIELGVAFELQPRREEALAHHAHLVLDLTLLPAGRRRACSRLYQIVAAHRLEATVV